MELKEQKVWFVTGASTGFGKELTKVVLDNDDKVIATFRKEQQVEAFNKYYPGNSLGVLMDVTDTEQIKKGVDYAIEQFGKIDVLVNNAGYGSLGSLEEIPENELRYQFEVNVFGAVNITKAILPHLRKQKSGNIINVTSIGGLVGFPGVSVYNGSKFALEGIGEALAQEVAHLGIKVTNVEPGPFRTDWAGRSASFADSTIEDYKESVGQRLESIKELDGNQVGDPNRAAKAIYKIAYLDNPPVHIPFGASAYEGARAKINQLAEEINAFEDIGLPTDYTNKELEQLQ